MKSISSFSRRIGIAFILIGLAGALTGGIIYMTTVISLPEITLKSETLNTTTTSLVLLNNQSYVINFTITDYNLPYTLLFSNNSNITTGHNLTAINESSTQEYTVDSVSDVAIHNAKTLYIRYYAYDESQVNPSWYFNITTTQHTYSFIIDASTGSPADYVALYVDNVLVHKEEAYQPLDVEYIVFDDNNIQYIVSDWTENNTVISYNDNYGEIIRIQTNVDNYLAIYYVETTAINYYLDNDLINSSTTLKNINYIYDDLYLDNTIILENYTIRSVQSSEPITIYYYKETSVDMGIILDIIAVLFGILLIVKAAGYMGVRL